jgi:hypothetical protein
MAMPWPLGEIEARWEEHRRQRNAEKRSEEWDRCVWRKPCYTRPKFCSRQARVFWLEHLLRVSFPWASADVQNDERRPVWEDERLQERHAAMLLETNVEIRREMQVQFA